MAVTKTKKRASTSTIAIVILSVLLVASVAIGITLAYFTANATVTGNITLGDPVTISITQGGASVTSLTFDGNALQQTLALQQQIVGLKVMTTIIITMVLLTPMTVLSLLLQ